MPTIVREDGYEIRIYTLDHPPPHVHVAKVTKHVQLLRDAWTKIHGN
jgi:hypothetical protein